MNTADENLAHSIKVTFGTAPHEPSETQLAGIKRDIKALGGQVSRVNDADWLRVVTKHCPSTGTYKYAGVDNSDLNTLLALATRSSSG